MTDNFWKQKTKGNTVVAPQPVQIKEEDAENDRVVTSSRSITVDAGLCSYYTRFCTGQEKYKDCARMV